MSTVSGTWYDANASTAHAAVLEIDAGAGLRVRLADRMESAALAEVQIAPRLGDAPRRIVFPGGGLFETGDNDALDDALRRVDGGHPGWLHWLESRWLIGVVLLVPVVLLTWWVAVSGVPALAGVVAQRIPASLTRELGAQLIQSLEYLALDETQLSPARQASLRTRFDDMVAAAGIEGECELRFYASPRLGPNALAIPPCVIAITDELVGLAGHDDELLAVLAHELGHVKHRHALRHMVQGALLSFILVAITGDATQIPAGVAAAPALLLELRFSRDFEREADEFAHHFMRRRQIPLAAFPRILRRMEDYWSEGDSVSRGGSQPEPDWSQYLTTHPASEERARLFER